MSALALLLLTPAIGTATEGHHHRPPRPATCAVAVLSAGESPDAGVFSAAKTLDLTLATAFSRRVEGIHRLELRLYAPQGVRYQTFLFPFDAGVGERRRWRRSPATASATLPVAGTAIMTEALFGTWRVVAYLDDSDEPCGPAGSFEIGP